MGATCVPAAARQRGSGQPASMDLAAGSARGTELGPPRQARGTPPLPAEGKGPVAPEVYIVVEYGESGGRICNSRSSLLFSSGIPLRIVPLKRRFAQMATMSIDQKNTEYPCL